MSFIWLPSPFSSKFIFPLAFTADVAVEALLVTLHILYQVQCQLSFANSIPAWPGRASLFLLGNLSPFPSLVGFHFALGLGQAFLVEPHWCPAVPAHLLADWSRPFCNLEQPLHQDHPALLGSCLTELHPTGPCPPVPWTSWSLLFSLDSSSSFPSGSYTVPSCGHCRTSMKNWYSNTIFFLWLHGLLLIRYNKVYFIFMMWNSVAIFMQLSLKVFFRKSRNNLSL